MKYYCTKCKENRSSNHCHMCDVELFEVVKTKMKVGDKFFTPNGIGMNGLDEFECMAELLANCLDWNINKYDSNKRAEIHIITDRRSFIQIIDNGVGMNIEQLDKATNLADDTDVRRRLIEQEQRKGMYNMGMKVATLSLGWKLTITTISIEEQTKELVFEFDSKNLLDSNSEYMENLKIVPRVKPTDSPLNDFKSGTSILIENIVSSKVIPNSAVIADQMVQRFQPDMAFLKQKDKLLFLVYDGEKNIRKNLNEPEVNQGTIRPVKYYHEILKIDFENPQEWDHKREYKYTGRDEENNSVQYQLKGFINILKKRSISGDSGLNLYCRGQLIERFVKTDGLDHDLLGGFKARNWERIYGELHLDGCLANNVKTKLNRNEAFYEVCKLIKDDLIQTYKKLTGSGGDANLKLDQEVARRLATKNPDDIIDPDDPTDPTDPDIPTDPDDPIEPVDPIDPLLEKEDIIKVNNKLYFQIRENWFVPSSRSKRTWKAMRNEIYQNEYPNKQIFELQIQIHTDSAQYKKIKEMYRSEADQNKVTTFFHKLIICEAITEIIFELNLFDKNKAREIVDQIVSPQIFNMKI